MPKPATAAEHLPASAAKALRDLGENLALARQRRKESLRAWASRMAVSVPTLISMSLWWLANPAAPQRIGTVSLQDNRSKLGLSYASGWLAGQQSFALSEDLPLRPVRCLCYAGTRLR